MFPKDFKNYVAGLIGWNSEELLKEVNTAGMSKEELKMLKEANEAKAKRRQKRETGSKDPDIQGLQK